ncbi:hypothetical protein LguiA_023262 [Lonicera macranthoides]
MENPPKRHKQPSSSIQEQKTLEAEEDPNNNNNNHNQEQERGGGGGGGGGDDIISNLPDAILCHILSKLPTKHAIGTSILSSQWNNLFPSIPRLTLEFDDSLLLHPTPDDDKDNETANNSNNSLDRLKTNFINFTYRVMDVILQDVTQISQFCLKCCQEYDDTHIVNWISSALKRNAKLLDLGISMVNPLILINCLTGCTALKYLSLGKNLPLDVPDSFCLPSLKYLLLDEIEFVNDDSLLNLFAGCPVLEDLSMCDCDLQHIELLNISIPSLKGLIIEYCYDDEIGYQVVLDTPLLEMLIFKDHAAIRYYMRNLNNVRQAHIEIEPTKEQLEDDSIYYSRNIAEFVASCSTADSLYLSRDTIRAVRHSCHQIPVFGNLTWMQLAGFDKSGWELLPQLLESAPNLEWLEITEGFYDDKGCYTSFEARLPENVPVSLSSHIKKIDLWSFTGEEDEVQLVEYFLKTAKVLNKMEISCDLSWDKYLSMRKRLSMLPRLSETCRLFLSKNKKVMEY